MTESEAIRARHAVRNYTTKPLSPAVIDGLKEEIDQCNRLGQLHIQLVTRVSWLRLNKQVLTRVGSQIHTMREYESFSVNSYQAVGLL